MKESRHRSIVERTATFEAPDSICKKDFASTYLYVECLREETAWRNRSKQLGENILQLATGVRTINGEKEGTVVRARLVSVWCADA